jgi:hypothetical protein
MTLCCPRRNVVCVLLTGLLILLLASPGSAQVQLQNTVPYSQRTDAFRRLLYELKFQPHKTFAELQAKPRESVLIVLGDPKCLSRGDFPEGLRSFVRQGGAVLIATDKEVEGDARKILVEVAGVTVTGETFFCRDREDIYRNATYCPFVQPIAVSGGLPGSTNVLGTLAAVIGAGGRPALFRNPRPDSPDLRVATNAPSRLKELGWFGLPGGINRLARLPAACRNQAWGDLSLLDPEWGEKGPLFAVGGALGEGRVLVLADHSIFINRMILPRDTGNLEFTANCLHWLRGGAMSTADILQAARGQGGVEQLTGQRTKALFWDDGQIRTDFHVAMKEVPIHPKLPSTPALIAAFDQAFTRSADQYLAKKQETNALNNGLLDSLGERGSMTLWRTIICVLTFALLLVLGYRFVWGGRYQLDAATPLLGRAVAQHEPRASLIEQRRRAVLRAGNVWETAHQLARQCFETAGIPLTSASAPRIVVQGNWWHRWRVSRRVARLWELAQGTAPARIPPAALKRWMRELEDLKKSLANGTILFNAECRMQNAE